jgi:alkanesulfonate monooxygenase SsuD/methylene tetrahydromethanopterin reductase-like flavin-dependent oxidoreductase (luciferase family)
VTGAGAGTAATVKVGFRPPHDVFGAGPGALAALLDRAAARGIDQVCVGDHVSFRGGRGFDGLVQATALAALAPTMTVHTAVYLLPLRHPVTVARQVASLAEFAPGRIVFGVGAGGDDRHEVAVCGIDPATRGQRMDECLSIVRRLLAGETVSYGGRHVQISDARILPAPAPPVPILVGGRSVRAARRAAMHGDGWIGVWVTPERFETTTADVEQRAAAAGRTGVAWQHELLVWCGFGATREHARAHVAAAMERLYGLRFERFARYCPFGTPDDVASALLPYVEAGCRSLNLVPMAADLDETVEGVATVRDTLRDAVASTPR